MPNKTDSLRQLINSLSRSDKRFFSALTRIQHGEKSYLRYYELMAKNPDWDSSQLAEKIGISPDEGGHFTLRNYLKKNVFKGLALSKLLSCQYQILYMVIPALIQKGLLDEARRVALSALKRADQTENFNRAIEICLMLAQTYRELPEKLGETEEFQWGLMTKQHQYIHWESVLNGFRWVLSSGQAYFSKDQKTFFSIWKGKGIIPAEKDMFSSRARRSRLGLLMVLFLSEANTTKLIKTATQWKRLFAENKFLEEEYWEDHLQVLLQLAFAQASEDNLAGGRRTLQILEKIEIREQYGRRIKGAVICLVKIRFSLLSPDYLKEVNCQSGLSRIQSQLPASLVQQVQYYSGLSHFMQGAFEEARDFIYPLLMQGKVDSGQKRGWHIPDELMGYARLLFAYINLELGEPSLQESYSQSAYKFFHTRKWLGEYERYLLRVLDLASRTDEKGKQPLYRQINTVLEEMETTKSFRRGSRWFNLYNWLKIPRKERSHAV